MSQLGNRAGPPLVPALCTAEQDIGRMPFMVSAMGAGVHAAEAGFVLAPERTKTADRVVLVTAESARVLVVRLHRGLFGLTLQRLLVGKIALACGGALGHALHPGEVFGDVGHVSDATTPGKE